MLERNTKIIEYCDGIGNDYITCNKDTDGHCE